MSNRKYLPTYRKPRLVAHTLNPPLPFVLPRLLSAWSLTCNLTQPILVSALSLPMHVGSFQVPFET